MYLVTELKLKVWLRIKIFVFSKDIYRGYNIYLFTTQTTDFSKFVIYHFDWSSNILLFIQLLW